MPTSNSGAEPSHSQRPNVCGNGSLRVLSFGTSPKFGGRSFTTAGGLTSAYGHLFTKFVTFTLPSPEVKSQPVCAG
jgi:hypothetical protein